MKLIFIFVLVCLSSVSFSQNYSYKWLIQVKLSYENNNNYYTRAYFDTGTEINQTTDQYKSEVGHTQRETKLIKNSSPKLACQFIQDGLLDSMYALPLNLIDLDSADLAYLNQSGFIEDSCVIINFPLFTRQAGKTIKACDECYPTLTHKRDDSSRDVDELLLHFVVNTEQIVLVYLGKDKYSSVYNFQKWLLFEEVNRKYQLFDNPEVQYYFSRKRLSEEMKDYVVVLKR